MRATWHLRKRWGHVTEGDGCACQQDDEVEVRGTLRTGVQEEDKTTSAAGR